MSFPTTLAQRQAGLDSSPVSPNGSSPRQAAVALWLARHAKGVEMTGSELAERFGRSPSWGRAVAREARRQAQQETAVDDDSRTPDHASSPAQPRAHADPAEVEPDVSQADSLDDPPIDVPAAGETATAPRQAATAAGGWQTLVTGLAVVAVALAAAWASAGHLSTVASRAGEGTPWLLPVSVDGLLVAASMVLYRAHQSGQRPGVIPWLALLLGIVGSVLGNVVAVNAGLVDEGTVSVLVAAWPPLSLALSFELLLRMVRSR